MIKSSLLKHVLCATYLLSLGTSGQALAQIHTIADIAHEFSFYTDGRFKRQYIPESKCVSNWGNLYSLDASNINLILLLGCAPAVRYNDKDIAYLTEFMQGGGAVLLASKNADNVGQNQIAKLAGASFGPQAKKPFQATEALKAIAPDCKGIVGVALPTLVLENPEEWCILATDKDGLPLIASKKMGEGQLLLSGRGLIGSRPDAKDNINAEWITPLMEEITKNKSVNSKKAIPTSKVRDMGVTKELASLSFHSSDYLEPYLDDMIKIANKALPLLEKRLGVPLSDGMGASISLLATGGGGFSAGGSVALAVFWAGFPEHEEGMYEFLSHEFTHSWVLPHPEIWNEPIATFVGDLILQEAGYEEEGLKRIAKQISRASKLDESMKKYDLEGNALCTDAPALSDADKRNLFWGKSFWVLDQLNQMDPMAMQKYLQTKRAYVPAKLSRRYSIDDTVAIYSKALGRDLFPWFNEHGMACSADKVAPEIQEKLKK